jgi:hypothetical protein
MQELLPPERTNAHIYKEVMQRSEADSFLEPGGCTMAAYYPCYLLHSVWQASAARRTSLSYAVLGGYLGALDNSSMRAA